MAESLRIIVAHNTYQQKGGEDAVVKDELQLLKNDGHSVLTYLRDNSEIPSIGKLALASDTLWSNRTRRDALDLIDQFLPDVIHVHNTFPLISPSLYWAAAARRVPVIQTLHNFRLLCPQAMLLREGKVCEDCVGKIPWRGVVRRCYRDSASQTAVLSGMLLLHRAIGTFQKRVSRYIVLNDFCRDVFVRGGLPAERLRVKPNFVGDPGTGTTARDGLLFVGRLSAEKGIATLAGALALSPSQVCEVIGAGAEDVVLNSLSNVKRVGWQQSNYIYEKMKTSIALLMPSVWYENLPRTLVEAFACGLPVIGSRLGAMASLIRDGETGLLFEPGNATDLAAKLAWARDNPVRMTTMGNAARLEYEQLYTPLRNLSMLLSIYRDAITDK